MKYNTFIIIISVHLIVVIQDDHVSETQSSEQVEHLRQGGGVETGDGGGVHDRSQVNMVLSLSGGHEYPGYVRVPGVGHPEQRHVHLPLPLTIQFTEDLVLQENNQLRPEHQPPHLTK